MNAHATKHYTNRSNTLRALKSQYGNDVASRAGELIGKDSKGFYIRAELLNATAPADAAPWETQQTTPASAPATKSLAAMLLAQVAREKLAAPIQAKQKRVRVEQNGIVRPGSKGVCGQVWSALDSCVQNGQPVTLASILVTAQEKEWNANNVKIEFYRWRKFNKEV